MLAALLDSLHIDSVDLIGNDSGGLLAQIFLAKYPKRVRALLLTNCDVDENSPPPQFAPLVMMAEKGAVADTIRLCRFRLGTRLSDRCARNAVQR